MTQTKQAVRGGQHMTQTKQVRRGTYSTTFVTKPETRFECWTCRSASTRKPLAFLHDGCSGATPAECPGVEYHRSIGHDVRPVREERCPTCQSGRQNRRYEDPDGLSCRDAWHIE